MISFMFDRLLSCSEAEIGMTSDSALDWNRLRLFPDLLLSLSHVIQHLDDVPNSKAIRLERILVKFFQEFPNIFPSHSAAGYRGNFKIPEGYAFKTL